MSTSENYNFTPEDVTIINNMIFESSRLDNTFPTLESRGHVETRLAEKTGKVIDKAIYYHYATKQIKKSMTDYINIDLAEEANLSGRQIERLKKLDGFPDDKSILNLISAMPILAEFDPNLFPLNNLHHETAFREGLFHCPELILVCDKLEYSPLIAKLIALRFLYSHINDTDLSTTIYSDNIELNSMCIRRAFSFPSFTYSDMIRESRNKLFDLSFDAEDHFNSKAIQIKDFGRNQIIFPNDSTTVIIEQVDSDTNPLVTSKNTDNKKKRHSFKDIRHGWKFLYPDQVESNSRLLQKCIVPKKL